MGELPQEVHPITKAAQTFFTLASTTAFSSLVITCTNNCAKRRALFLEWKLPECNRQNNRRRIPKKRTTPTYFPKLQSTSIPYNCSGSAYLICFCIPSHASVCDWRSRSNLGSFLLSCFYFAVLSLYRTSFSRKAYCLRV